MKTIFVIIFLFAFSDLEAQSVGQQMEQIDKILSVGKKVKTTNQSPSSCYCKLIQLTCLEQKEKFYGDKLLIQIDDVEVLSYKHNKLPKMTTNQSWDLEHFIHNVTYKLENNINPKVLIYEMDINPIHQFDKLNSNDIVFNLMLDCKKKGDFKVKSSYYELSYTIK